MNMKRFSKWYYVVPAVLVMVPAVLAAIGKIVELLWNALLPALFGWPRITFWQSLGLLVLCRILFGGLGSGGGNRSKDMTPEERERFRQRMRDHYRDKPESHESKASPAQ
jgi:hypothetical protein